MDWYIMKVNERTLAKAAWLARERAYAPYSNFKVGAAIETEAGQIFTGCNVENATYGLTVCAERTAIQKAVSEGALAPGQLKTIVVATKTDEPVSPCGACRQVIQEFATPETKVMLSNTKGKVGMTYTQAELLPGAFTKEDLGS
jgi:cytidine deaminase